MKKFSDIGTLFLEAHGLRAVQCQSEQEAREMAASLTEDSRDYPVYYFVSDTTGEKPFEEFYTEDEDTDLDSFPNLGVIKNAPRKNKDEISGLVRELQQFFNKSTREKQELVNLLKSYLPGFAHVETGKNLDQKM